MATYVDQAYYGWPHEELPNQDDSQEVSASQMLDHGSISFGRFEYESLSWEKRSVFTYNKCQEEVEKFKSPGLVAKKKAYFEEYYKRIRAMKAMQESQQTEITLDYSGDCSISSQTREEDEKRLQLENVGGGLADVVVHPEEAPIEVPVEEREDCSKALEVRIALSDPQLMLPDSDSSRNNFEEQEEKTIYPHQMQHLDMDKSAHESLTIGIEDKKQYDLSDLHDKGVSKEDSISVRNAEAEVASGETTSYPANSNVEDVELKPTHSMVARKAMRAVRKYKNSISVPKLKEPPGPSRDCSKLEDKGKPNIPKLSGKPKCPIQKTIVKSGSDVDSSKATSDKVSRNNRSTVVPSHRRLREVHSNVTIPCPFSLATDSRAAVPSGSREGAPKLISKSSNQISSSSIKGKDAINVQETQEARVISFQRADIKVLTPSAAKLKTDSKAFTHQAAKQRTETKKMTQSQMGNSLLSGRRPQFGEQSLAGKKLRKEKPRWR